jgi:hypothetical protein
VERDGTLEVPHFHNDRGWEGLAPLSARFLAHLWTASMAPADLALCRRLRDHRSRDYDRVTPHFSKHGGGHEAAWLAFLQGEYPHYPVDILTHSHGQVYQRLAFMQEDGQDPATYGDWYLQVRNPVFAEGLVQLTMGGPLFNYNGGLLLVRLCYYDAIRRRPGLPEDVAALVERLEDRRAILRLVNLSPRHEREVVVQAGAFGEHRFTEVRHAARGAAAGEPSPHWTDLQHREHAERSAAEQVVRVDDRCFGVSLKPGAEVRLDLGMERFANRPRYGLPW